MLMAVFQTIHASRFPLFLPQTVLEETLWDNWHRYTYTDRMSFPLPNKQCQSTQGRHRALNPATKNHPLASSVLIHHQTPEGCGTAPFYDVSPMPLRGK